MSKRVFIIHGWGGNPNKDWIPWASSEIENKGYEVANPPMPNTDTPKINDWVSKLKELVGQPRGDDILIGHSIGCQAILRFLEGLPENQRVDKVILVAPWLKLINLESKKEWDIAKPWLEDRINFTKVGTKAKTFITIFSDNDQWVPLKENRKMFKEYLNPNIVVLHDKGHFTGDEGVVELPEVLKFTT